MSNQLLERRTVTTPEGSSAQVTDPARTVRTGLRSTGTLLRRRRWVALVVFALTVAVVAIGLAVTEHTYTASARIAVTPKVKASAPVDFDDVLGTVADVASSRPLLTELAGRFPSRTVEQLRHEVKGTVVSGTLLVQVSVSDPDRARAAQIANAAAEALPDYAPTDLFDYHVTERAVEPIGFSSPNLPLVALLGLLIAAFLAVVAAAIADRKFRTVADSDELGEAAETSVLGVLPKPDDPSGVPALDIEAEAFQALRALRIGVEFASAEDPSRLLVVASVSSADPWPGWVEVNLAAALAEVGHRVLVINADREGKVHPALVSPGGLGLYDVLSGSCDLDEAIAPGPTGNVDVLPVGHAHLAGPSLLEMRFRGFLEDTDEEYDVVIVHAASVSGSEDARIMAIHGAMLLTVPAGRVHPRVVRRAAEHMRGIRLRVLGSVLVGVRPARRRRRTAAAA